MGIILPVAETRINASIFPKHFTVSSVTADPSKGTVAKYYRNWWVRLKLAKWYKIRIQIISIKSFKVLFTHSAVLTGTNFVTS